MVAGGGFEPPTFGLCDLTHLSMRVGLYLHPRGMLAVQSLRLPPPFRGLGSVLPYRSRDVGSTDFDEGSSGTLLRRTPNLQKLFRDSRELYPHLFHLANQRPRSHKCYLRTGFRCSRSTEESEHSSASYPDWRSNRNNLESELWVPEIRSGISALAMVANVMPLPPYPKANCAPGKPL